MINFNVKHIIFLLYAIVWMMAFFGLSIFEKIEAWHFTFQIQNLNIVWILVWLGSIFITYRYIPTSKHPLLLLFLIAYFGQYLVSFSGTSPILFYTSETGHAEFVVTASRDFSMEDVFRRYEVLVEQPHQRFSPSKPPGQLLLYMLFDRMSPSLEPIQFPKSFVDMRHFQLGLYLTYILPLLAALTTIPIYLLGKEFKMSKPWLPSLLYSVSTPFVLVLMHFDQAIYPFISTTVGLTTVYASKYKNRKLLLFSFVSGLIFAIGSFISFSIAPTLLLLPILLLCANTKNHLNIHIWSRGILSFLTAVLLFYLLLYFSFDYNPIHRYQKAMIYHANWKGWNGSWSILWLSIRVNLLEYFWWIGPSVGFLFAKGIVPLDKESTVIRKQFLYLGTGLLLIIAFMLCFGKTLGEVNRLWLFITPFYWLLVSFNIDEKDHNIAIIGCSMWTLLIKIGMDFF